MTARIELCRERGVDAAEPDLLDACLNNTGIR